MHIVLYGGSFNPPHVLHELVCLYAMSTASVPIDQIWMVPCKEHPFGKKNIPLTHRLAMCELATRHIRNFVKVSDITASLDGPSYTFNTVLALSKQYPSYQFSVLIGSDVLPDKERWYKFQELDRLVQWIVVPRFPTMLSGNFSLPDVSSTGIRALISQGTIPTHLLDTQVIKYIQENQLYT